MNKKAFTLSEILITLGVVGVVAVLTVPGVMRNYQNRLYTAQLEKTYAQISDALQAIMNDENVDNFYETTAGTGTTCYTSGDKKCTTGLGYFFQNYFKTIKTDCMSATNTTEPCLKNTTGAYKTVGGVNVAVPHGNYFVQTTSGAVIGGFYNASNNCMSIIVDVNGIDEPNVAGRDTFSMDIRANGTIADYNSGCGANAMGAAASTCTTGSTGSIYDASAGCLSNVIEAGWKMEY